MNSHRSGIVRRYLCPACAGSRCHGRMKHILLRARNASVKLARELRIRLQEKLYLSFGENCLPDNILDRHGLKSFATPFSHGQSNVEYILNLERDKYKYFMDPGSMQYRTLGNKEVPVLMKYREINNDYFRFQKDGVEFTHHDVIKNAGLRTSMTRRVERLHRYIGRKRYIILYHHRLCEGTDQAMLVRHLGELKEIYAGGKGRAEVVCFTQRLVDNASDRKLAYELRDGIHLFTFHTLQMWHGGDDEVFWARRDEDLVGRMAHFLKDL